MITLICDLNITTRGHNAGYAQYVIDHIEPKAGDQIYFLFNRSAREVLTFSSSPDDHILFTEEDFPRKSLYDKFKFREWKAIKQVTAQLKIDQLFLMDLTHYELQIGRSKTYFKISGIEFRPSHRIKSASSNISIRLTASFQRYKRRFFETLLLQSRSLERIFILNDPEGVKALNCIYHTDIFQYLVDPIYDYENGTDYNNPETSIFRPDPEKVTFIIFGSLDGRKNIANSMEAFCLIDRAIQKNMTLLIAGKIPGYFKEEFDQLVRKFNGQHAGVELVVIDAFITNQHMEYLYSVSDVSLAIYSKFYGSSALLGRAAKHNTISLVPNVGLMAELCNHYRLGYLCDPTSPSDISTKIVSAYHDIRENKRVNGLAYYRSHSPQRFIELLNL